eukprot:NODE_33_length_32023_cov_0.217579.p6 type:complete len:450 gc:universal NODE_33_length_32023_cov_0.217579:11256-12605(+)
MLNILKHRLVEPSEKYCVDWLKKYKGVPKCVYEPKNTQEVQEIVRYCFLHNYKIVPQGGNTGLVGGAIPIGDEVVINLSKMNRVYDINRFQNTALVDSGVILQQLDMECSKQDLMVPLDLGAKGSCQIGGNVATNAGGLRYLRYGCLSQNVLSLEVVLPNGELLPMSSGMKKDNTGYHLKNLFVGSEGTLGIITKALIQVVQKPKSVQVAVLALKSYSEVVSLFQHAKYELNEILSAFEFWDKGCMSLNEKYLNCRQPFDKLYPFYALIETHGSNIKHDLEKINSFLEKHMDEIIIDGVIAQSHTEAQDLWRLREGIPEACNARGKVYKYDVSLPIASLYGLVESTQSRLSLNTKHSFTDCVGYGHMGDGNLHLNVCAKTFNDDNKTLLEPFVYEFTQKLNGSISAEHGIGQMKRNALHYSKSKEHIDMMKSFKALIDPKQIMNPSKLF